MRPDVPIVYIDDLGLFHFVERIAMRDAQRLVFNTPHLPLPFDIAGRTLLTIEWPIVFERPEPLVFGASALQRAGSARGDRPPLRSAFLFEVAAGDSAYAGLVEESDVEAFAIVSRGGGGTPGVRGSDGSAGASGALGMSAMCPSSPGQSGGPGGRGGNGTNGGAGVPAEMVARCSSASRA